MRRPPLRVCPKRRVPSHRPLPVLLRGPLAHCLSASSMVIIGWVRAKFLSPSLPAANKGRQRVTVIPGRSDPRTCRVARREIVPSPSPPRCRRSRPPCRQRHSKHRSPRRLLSGLDASGLRGQRLCDLPGYFPASSVSAEPSPGCAPRCLLSIPATCKATRRSPAAHLKAPLSAGFGASVDGDAGTPAHFLESFGVLPHEQGKTDRVRLP